MAESISRGELVYATCYALLAIFCYLADATDVVTGGLCSGSAATSTCPSPGPLPVADLDLTAYQGRWFEIGSSGNFKLFTESGFSCVQARYSPLNDTEREQFPGATIRVRNSGVPFLGNGVRRPTIAIAASNSRLCSSLKKWCGVSSLQALQDISYAVDELDGGNHGWYAYLFWNYFWDSRERQIRYNVKVLYHSLSTIEYLIESISGSVSSVQSLTASISQGTGGDVDAAKSQLDSIADAIEKIQVSLTAAAEASDDIAKIVETARADISEKEVPAYNKIEEANNVIRQLVSGAGEIVENATAAQADTSTAFEQLVAAADVPLNTSAVPPSLALGVAGRDTSSDREGQLQVSFPFVSGAPAPYWVIAIEGTAAEGYTAALVYSCQERGTAVQGVDSGDPGVFILSRTPTLDPRIIKKFFAVLVDNGVVLSCSNPFIFTPQSEELCKAYI